VRGKRSSRLQPGLRAVFGALVAVAALAPLVLSSCGSSAPAALKATSTTARHPTSARASTTTNTTTTTTPSTSPSAPTSGPLQTDTPIEIPFSADRVTAAEGPDGAVFVAPQDPTTPGDAVAWVVDGNSPAAIAEHVPNGIAALAADGNNFYAATYGDVYAFDRASGNQVAQWTLPPVRPANGSDDNLVSMVAAGGNVLVSITQGSTVRVYRINPAKSAPPRSLVQGLGVAFGADGSVYYERADHHLAVLRSSGATAPGPRLASLPNGQGGGVQYLEAVAGGAVWVSQPTGQGLDAGFATFDVATLNQLGSFSGTTTSSVVETGAGPLVLQPAGSAACPPPAGSAPPSCVLRIDVHGSTSDPLAVDTAALLLGPSPAVVAADTSTDQFQLVRLS
jgi:hypothetical protein